MCKWIQRILGTSVRRLGKRLEPRAINDQCHAFSRYMLTLFTCLLHLIGLPNLRTWAKWPSIWSILGAITMSSQQNETICSCHDQTHFITIDSVSML